MVGIDATTKSMAIFASSPVHISYLIGAEIRATRSPAPRLSVLMPIQDIVATLNEYQPEIISTFPSFVRALAGEQDAGRMRIKPRFIRRSAEALRQEVRDIAGTIWGATVTNSYTCTEAGSMGHECESGDAFWRISAIDGRREELLHFERRDGSIAEVHAHRLRSPLTRAQGVRQFQFSELPNGLELTVSVFSGVDVDQIRQKIEYSMRATLEAIDAEPEAIIVKVVDAIERTGPGAKERLVVNITRLTMTASTLRQCPKGHRVSLPDQSLHLPVYWRWEPHPGSLDDTHSSSRIF